MPSRVSLAPPPSETDIEKAQDKWAEPAMPESSHLLLPHTQQLLRIARSGKYGTKRKTAPDVEPDGDDFNAREEEGVPDEVLAKPNHTEEKGFMARKWRQVPESALVPEHLHWEFLAKRRKGLPNYYHGGANDPTTGGVSQAAKRKTRVQKVLDVATGESVIYEVVALEGQVLENELPADSQMQATHLEPGTTIEGLGTAGEDGLISLIPSGPVAPQRVRNRPPPKKKGGPGRGKKRVTFTNPDGSTYTTIVPNATKIVPQPGQTVKHVAKGEDAGKDVSMEEAARLTHEAGEGGDQDEDRDDDEEGDDGDDDDEDREDGEIQEDDADVAATPAKKSTSAPAEATIVETQPAESTPIAHTPKQTTPIETLPKDEPMDQQVLDEPKPDVDVEMQDRPAEVEPEIEPKTESETKPVPEPVDQTERQPELQPEAVETVPEVQSQPPPKPEPQHEPTQVDDAMDIEPAESFAVENAVAPPVTVTQEVDGKPEPLAAEVASENPEPVMESEVALEQAEATPKPAEQVLEVEVDIPTDAPVDPTPVESAPVDSAPVDSAPVEPAPVEPAPVDSAPMETPPVEIATVDPAPVDSAPVNSDAPAVTEAPEVPEAPQASEEIAQVQEDVTTQEKSPAQEPPQPPAKIAEQGEDLLGSLERSLEG